MLTCSGTLFYPAVSFELWLSLHWRSLSLSYSLNVHKLHHRWPKKCCNTYREITTRLLRNINIKAAIRNHKHFRTLSINKLSSSFILSYFSIFPHPSTHIKDAQVSYGPLSLVSACLFVCSKYFIKAHRHYTQNAWGLNASAWFMLSPVLELKGHLKASTVIYL